MSHNLGVRHFDEAVQGRTAVSDRPRDMAARARRARMIGEASKVRHHLAQLSASRTAPSRAALTSARRDRGQSHEMHGIQMPKHPDGTDLTWVQAREGG